MAEATEASPAKKPKKSTAVPRESGAKRLCLDIKTKIQIIVDKNEFPKLGQRQLARKYGCSKSQIQRILSHSAEIIKDWESDCSSSRKRGRSETYKAINTYLWEWYQKCIASNIIVNGRMLHDEALAYAKLTGVTTFDASRGWLEKWKKRHGVSFTVDKYAASCGSEQVKEQKINSWKELMATFQPDDIWSMEQTGMFWKALPTKSSETGSCIERNSDQQLTWAFFFNAAGEKMEPIVVGKRKVPKSFRKLRMPERPFGCRYFNNQKSLMEKDIMKLTLMRLDRRLSLERRQILLFLDNVPYYPKTLRDCVHNIHIEFLPKTSTGNIRPPESCLIRSWKIKSRIRLMRYISSKMESGLSVEEIMKTVSLLDAIQWGKLAWDELEPHTVTKCFKKVGIFSDEVEDLDDLFDGVEFMDLKYLCEKIDTEYDATQYIEDDVPLFEVPVDASDPKWREMLQQQLIKNIIITQGSTNADDDDDSDHIDDGDVVNDESVYKSAYDACQSLEQIKLYAYNIDDEDLANMLENALDRLRSISIVDQSREKYQVAVLNDTDDVEHGVHAHTAKECDIHDNEDSTVEQDISGHSHVVMMREHNSSVSISTTEMIEHNNDHTKEGCGQDSYLIQNIPVNKQNIDALNVKSEQQHDSDLLHSVVNDAQNISNATHNEIENEGTYNPTHTVVVKYEQDVGDNTVTVTENIQNVIEDVNMN